MSRASLIEEVRQSRSPNVLQVERAPLLPQSDLDVDERHMFTPIPRNFSLKAREHDRQYQPEPAPWDLGASVASS
jgi:hypothetical protein